MLALGVEPRGLEPLTPCLQSKCATNCAMAPDHGAPSVWMAPRKACCAMVPTRWRETSVATTINNVFNETAWLQPATEPSPSILLTRGPLFEWSGRPGRLR